MDGSVLVHVAWLIAGGILAGTGIYLKRRLGNALREAVRRLVEPVLWKLNRWTSRSVAVRMSLKTYCRSLAATPEIRTLYVPGRSRATDLLIDNVYVPLTLESGTRREIRDPQEIWSNFVTRVRIIGEPGSGKSTLVKRLFLDATSAVLTGSPGRLPILVELRHLKAKASLKPQAATKWLLSELRERVTSVRGYEMAELFDTSLSGGDGLLILLDGLDEVPNDIFPVVAEAIIGLSKLLSNENPKNQLVLTMRLQFHEQVRAQFDGHFESTYVIQPFTSSDVFHFLSRWPFGQNRSAEINRIYGELTDRPTLREMCSNPLVLAMYVANDQGGGGRGAPDTRTDFYNLVLEELLVARRSRQLGVHAKSALQTQRERVLGPLAYENLADRDRPANSIPWDRAVALTREVYSCGSLAEAEAELLGLCTDTGILAEERPRESLRFIHLTFCEFLAARESVRVRENGWPGLMELHRAFDLSPQSRTRLVEVIPFAVGLLHPVQQVGALRDVWATGSRQLMGRCFLESQQYDHPTWAEFCAAEANSLALTSPGRWNEPWLRRLHLYGVILSDEHDWRRLRGEKAALGLEEIFRRLVAGDKDKLLRLFSSYAVFDAPAAFRLARACRVDLLEEHPELLAENISEPPFLAMVLERVRAEPARIREWSCVLAEGALKDQGAAALLAEDDGEPWKPVTVPKSCRWWLEPVRFPLSGLIFQQEFVDRLRPSALTFAISLAVSCRPDLPPRWTRLTLISPLAPPRRWYAVDTARSGPLLLGLALVPMGVLGGFFDLPELVLPIGLMLIFVFAVLSLLTVRFRAVRDAYIFLINRTRPAPAADRWTGTRRRGPRRFSRLYHAARMMTAARGYGLPTPPMPGSAAGSSRP